MSAQVIPEEHSVAPELPKYFLVGGGGGSTPILAKILYLPFRIFIHKFSLPKFQEKKNTIKKKKFWISEYPASILGPCKVQNETESKRNETKQIETKWNKTS